MGFSNVIAFDDGPFLRSHVGGVTIVGAVFAKMRFDGLITGKVQKNGPDACDII